jgi:histone H3/H4
VSDPTRETTRWRRCSACKKDIPLGGAYWACNVSTCNRKRTAMQFCTVSCWEVHLPVARHRESWAEERRAPSAEQAARQAAGAAATPPARTPRRIIAEPKGAPSRRDEKRPGDGPLEVLIVASRLKDYVRAISGMNTSDRVLEPLSAIVREVVQRAIENARADERKTVLDRDIPKR